MHVTLIVGAGGTGSYFIEDIVHYYNALKDRRHIIVVDGDVVEQKNLLRQGFLKMDLDKGKADTLVNRYKKIVREGLTIESRNQFINTVDDVVHMVNGLDITRMTMVSCVDNNMARLRMTLAQYALHDKLKVKVEFVDSGNAEWHGQTITTVLEKNGETYLGGLYSTAFTGGRVGVREYEVRELDPKHIVASIFTTDRGWKDNLTKGDHEMSCDDVVESNPQNIGTNMMASKCLLMTLGQLDKKEFEGGEYNFNASSNSVTRRNEGLKEEEGYKDWVNSMLGYIKTKEGYNEVFGKEESLVEDFDDDEMEEDVDDDELYEDNEELNDLMEFEYKEEELTGREIDVEELTLTDKRKEGIKIRKTKVKKAKEKVVSGSEDLLDTFFDDLFDDINE